ncbi:MAG: hypothetical protein SGJ09_13515 [Phycisphaerae bacterium]|nr:hypothetical protein [Phycisphaerae bacterium]
MDIRRSFPLFVPFIVTAGALAASINYQVSLVPAQSTLTSTTTIAAPVVGTFIGNYDAVSNPTGTKTIPGLFGGSGNNAINYSAAFDASGDNTSHPTGGFAMSVDVGLLSFSVSNLAIDLLGATAASIDATATVTYSNFHTQNPNAIFPGLTLPLPLGTATLDALDATQTGGAIGGVLVPQGRTSYTFLAAIPVNLTAVVTLNGQTIATDPIPFALPIAGTIDFGGESVTLTASIASSFEQTTPLDPAPSFTAQPLDLPTILPPGGTAHLLFSGAISSITVGAGVDASFFADAVPQLNPADLNGDGIVGAADLGILLGAWGTSGPGDLSGDGVVGPADLGILLGAWS